MLISFWQNKPIIIIFYVINVYCVGFDMHSKNIIQKVSRVPCRCSAFCGWLLVPFSWLCFVLDVVMLMVCITVLRKADRRWSCF